MPAPQPQPAPAAARRPAFDPGKPPYERLLAPALGRDLAIERSADLEALWAAMDEDDFGPDERIPYWAELWPSSLALSRFLEGRPDLVRGKVCLDLGCGLGLTGIVAGLLGGRVIGLDHEWPAAFFARHNAGLNGLDGPIAPNTPITPDASGAPGVSGVSGTCGASGASGTSGACSPPLWTVMDWRAPALRAGSAQVVLAGDVLYEARFFAPLARFFDHVLAPGGRALIAEPRREVALPAWDRLAKAGLAVRTVGTETVPGPTIPVTVDIRELTKPGA